MNIKTARTPRRRRKNYFNVDLHKEKIAYLPKIYQSLKIRQSIASPSPSSMSPRKVGTVGGRSRMATVRVGRLSMTSNDNYDFGETMNSSRFGRPSFG